MKINRLRGSRLIGGGAIISDIKEEDDDEIDQGKIEDGI